MSGSIDRIVERQIREAQERGVFDNLPGAGKPLADVGGPKDENWWLRQYVQREGLDGVAFLPPALALRKEAEDIQVTAAELGTEAQVRELVTHLNDRILDALRKPSEGPPMTLMQLDVESVVTSWRAARKQTPGERQELEEPQRRKRSRLRRLFSAPIEWDPERQA